MKTYRRIFTHTWVLLLVCCAKLSSQNCANFKDVESGSRLECIQGIYIPADNENSDQSTFIIYQGFKFLSLTLMKNELSEIILGYVGFNDFTGYPTNKYGEIRTDSFNVCDLKQNGKYYVTILEKNVDPNLSVKDMFIQKEYSCDAGTIEVFNRNLTVYEKIDFLPYRAYEHVKERTKNSKRDLLSEFKITDKLLRAKIKTPKAYFHNEANDATIRKGFVVKGNQVIVDEIQSDWIKVAYEGKQSITTGWLKRSELELIKL